MNRVGRRSSSQSGSVVVEAVVLVPVVTIFILLTVAFGRVEVARSEVIGAARAGSEAASVAISPSQATNAASAAVSADLSSGVRSCAQFEVHTGTADFQLGGLVTVTVECRIDLSDLGAPGVSGETTFQVTQAAPIDPYRVIAS
jgi:TadE-like protein